MNRQMSTPHLFFDNSNPVGNKIENSVNCDRINMGIDVFRHVGYPEAKFIDNFGVAIKPEITSRRIILVIY
jgi:hypothetical protein